MGIRRCYCCQGFGHESKDCSNPVDVKINMETARQLHADQLHAYAARRGAAPGAPQRHPYPSTSSRGIGGGKGGRGRGGRRDAFLALVQDAWDNERGEEDDEDEGEEEAHYVDGGPSHLGSFEIVSIDDPFGDHDDAFSAVDTFAGGALRVQIESNVTAKDIDVPIDFSKTTELETLPEVLGVVLDDDDSVLPGNYEPDVQPEMLGVVLDGAGSVQTKMLGEMLDVVLDGVGSVQPETRDVVLGDASRVQHEMLDKVLDSVVDHDVNTHDGDIDEHAAEVWASFMSNIRADGDDAQHLCEKEECIASVVHNYK